MVIRPKPDFHPIFEVANTREGSGIAFNKPDAPDSR